MKQYECQMSPLYQLSPDANASPQVSSTLSNGGAERQTEVSERFAHTGQHSGVCLLQVLMGNVVYSPQLAVVVAAEVVKFLRCSVRDDGHPRRRTD